MISRQRAIETRERLQQRCLYGTVSLPSPPEARRRLFLLHRYRRTLADALVWLDWAEQAVLSPEGEEAGETALRVMDESLWLHLREGRWPGREWRRRAEAILARTGPTEETRQEEWRWRREWLRSLRTKRRPSQWIALYRRWQDPSSPPRSRWIWGFWLVATLQDEEEWHRLREEVQERFRRRVPVEWLPSYRVRLLRALNLEWTQTSLERLLQSAEVFPLWQEAVEEILSRRRLRAWQRRARWLSVQRHERPAEAWRETLHALQRETVLRLSSQWPSKSEQLWTRALQLVGERARNVREAQQGLRQVERLWPEDWEWATQEDLARLAQWYLWVGEGYVAMDVMAEVREWEAFLTAFPHFEKLTEADT